MANIIAGSGQIGRKGSKIEAETTVASLIGPQDKAFNEANGSSYISFMKSILTEYVTTRGVEECFVVKGYPFNWLSTVNGKCSAVILRKDYHKGEHLVEPELFFEVGVLSGIHGEQYSGVSFGFHYLDGADDHSSRFINGVLDDPELIRSILSIQKQHILNIEQMADGQAKDHDIVGHHHERLNWDVNSLIRASIKEEDMPVDLEKVLFDGFDEILPAYRKIIAL